MHRFTVSVAGSITGVRFFKSGQECGWDLRAVLYTWSSGVLQRSITVDSRVCTGSGWMKVDFSTPFIATPGVTYVVAIDGLSYYRKDIGYFSAPKTRGFITAHGSAYATSRYCMPRSIDRAVDCYWVDGKSHWELCCSYLRTRRSVVNPEENQ